MNIKGRNGRLTGMIVLSFFIAMSFFTCKKDGPTRAVITVVDRNKIPVQGATVTLWQDTAVNPVNGVQSTLRVTKVSDAAGKAEFDFELEAFLNIEAIKDPDTGRSFIRLKEHETVTATVNL
jgi:hypothetical protein